ncbi:UNVERIFIED_CONTAM: hypothetical protein Sradi_2032300 [Sesamum radiatum]|uniref:Uncharacterized protein n=1 Tax=Sesamum radiatum TaxID=300843 RepID=A0AAW2TG33_SESRA
MVIEHIEGIFRKFLWRGSSSKGCAKVAWAQVCLSKEQGGQGLQRLGAMNKALMARHLWDIIAMNDKSLWVKWVMRYMLKGHSEWTLRDSSGSSTWKKVLQLRSIIMPKIEYRIGDGNTFGTLMEY